MKKILICSGGTGPTALLKGLHETGVMKFAKVQMLINALDNGMSTGTCRQVFNGKLLGPSDVRKNAMRRYVQLHGTTPLSTFLDIRFDCESAGAQSYVIDKITDRSFDVETERFLLRAAEEFFKQPHASIINYHDFSMANLIYSGVASLHGLSLLKASKIINTELLEIEEDFVILNSDESVFVNAVTESGHVLTDEVDINGWNDANDRVASIFFTDPSGKKVPAPDLHPEAKAAIEAADIIIYSTGTQWTSLIPTYMTTGFSEALANSKAKQYLVMNNRSDTDMTGLSSADIIDVLAKFLPMESITTLINSGAQPHMQIMPVSKYPSVLCSLSTVIDQRRGFYHTGTMLAHTILRNYFALAITQVKSGATLMLDYDDTIIGRNGSFVEASKFNQYALMNMEESATDVVIVSGNSIRNIDTFYAGQRVFADNSCNEYLTITVPRPSDAVGAETLRHKLKSSTAAGIFTQAEIDDVTNSVLECGIDRSKISNRGNAGICVKPVAEEYRKAVSKLIQLLVGNKYDVHVTGRTTIDICKKGVTKMNVVDKFDNVVYLGDEWEDGNDANVYKSSQYDNSKITFVRVDDPADTALFFTALQGQIV